MEALTGIIRSIAAAGLIAVMFLLSAVSIASARPGDPVETYGQGGVSAPELSSGTRQTPSDLALLPGGQTVVVGNSEPGPKTLIVRYLSDGGLDPEFGADGIIEGTTGSWDRVEVQADGRLVVSGSREGLAVVSRFNPDGSLDSSFGSDGSVAYDPRPLLALDSRDQPEVEFVDLKVLPDGRIRGIGTFFECSESTYYGCSNAMMFSLTDTGAPDPDFPGPDGFVSLPQTGVGISGVIRDDGSALVARDQFGEPPYGSPLISSRIRPDGSQDPEYGGDWSKMFHTVRLDGSHGAAVVDSRGGLIVAAGTQLVRFGSGGEPDSEFGDERWGSPSGTATITTFDARHRQPLFTGVAIDGKDRILVSGGLVNGIRPALARDAWASSGVAGRLLASGDPDPTFGGAGIMTSWTGKASGNNRNRYLTGTTRILAGPDSTVILAGLGPESGDFTFTTSKVEGSSMELPTCEGKPVDYIGTPGRDRVFPYFATVMTMGGDDEVESLAETTVCAGSGDDRVVQKEGTARLFGGSGNDTLIGHSSGDTISGGPGDDRLDDAGWTDRLSGGPGRDSIKGGSRDDRLFGGSGIDRLLGGPGRDQLFGGPGSDQLDPGPVGPDLTDYRRKSPSISLLLTRTGKKEAKASMQIELKCGRETSLESIHMKPIKVNASSGRFRFRSDPGWRNWQGGSISIIEDIDGRFTNGKVSGRLRVFHADDSDYDPSCWTGPSQERNWIRFKATAEPKPRQFARQ